MDFVAGLEGGTQFLLRWESYWNVADLGHSEKTESLLQVNRAGEIAEAEMLVEQIEASPVSRQIAKGLTMNVSLKGAIGNSGAVVGPSVCKNWRCGSHP